METGKAREIFKTLKDDIANGKYDAASPMPSERTLMRRFGVARATVASALDELERAGFVRRRRGSGTYPVVKKPVTFAVILPDTEMPFHAAICNGLANCAKNAGGGNYSLLWASGDILSFSDLCVAEKIAGVFFEPLKGKAKLNGSLIARFRAAKIPVILIGGDAASKRTMCDILGVNTLANGRRTPILFTSPAAKRNPSLIAHGELLGDVALRLMLQRIAYPEHPPCELYLDIPGEPGKTSRRNKKGTKT
jgi:hypothetical protein